MISMKMMRFPIKINSVLLKQYWKEKGNKIVKENHFFQKFFFSSSLHWFFGRIKLHVSSLGYIFHWSLLLYSLLFCPALHVYVFNVAFFNQTKHGKEANATLRSLIFRDVLWANGIFREKARQVLCLMLICFFKLCNILLFLFLIMFYFQIIEVVLYLLFDISDKNQNKISKSYFCCLLRMKWIFRVI